MIERNPIGLRIKQLRIARRMTQEQLAKKSGLWGNWVCNLECGRRKPTIATAVKIAHALNVNIDLLIGVPINRSNHKPATKRKSNGKD